MEYNPFKNRFLFGVTLWFVISFILYKCGVKEASTIAFFIGLVYTISYLVKRNLLKKNKSAREKEFQKYIVRTGEKHFDHFNEPFEDGLAMQCFSCMERPYFYNVLEKEVEPNVNLYIGELEWVDHMELSINHCADSTYATRMATDTDGKQTGNSCYSTMCVLYDKGFKLPNFDLSKETLGKKAAELVKMNKTTDIDFDDDKKFSDAWWLCTNETMIVKDLFDKNIRTNFMRFANKNYRISGQGDMIIIITPNVLPVTEYYKVISDMKTIHRFMKTNNKFYKAPKNVIN